MTRDVEFTVGGGLKLFGIMHGPASGQTVLLAHGGGQTHWAWRRTVKALAENGFRAVAIDMRGHGQSEWATDGDYHHATFARDILDVAEQLGGKPDMVGASLGGIAGMIAEGTLRPGTFSSLTLVDITSRPDPAGVERVTSFMGANVKDGFANPEDAAASIAAYTPNRRKRAPSDSLDRYLRKGPDGRFRWHWDPAFLDKVNGPRIKENEELPNAARGLTLPVHLIRGGSSDLVPASAVADFREQVPHAVFTDIAGAGHMVVGDKNDAFSDAIITFLLAHRAD